MDSEIHNTSGERRSSIDWARGLEGMSEEVLVDHLADLRQQKRELLTAGADVIDLSMFNPDLPPARYVLDRLMEASGKAQHHRYAVSRGIRKLREAFAEKWYKRFGVTLDPDAEICATMGSKDALVQVMRCVTKPGDAVVTVAPVYPAYRAAAALAQLRMHAVPFVQDEEDLVASIETVLEQKGARLVVLNFPHNPTGRTVSRGFWEKLVDAARRYRAVVMHDFVYGELVHDGSSGVSALSVEGARDVVVESYSLSKAYSVPGWRVAAIAGGVSVVRVVSELKSNIDYGIFLPVQMAAAAALEGAIELSQSAVREYRSRASALCGALRREGFTVESPQAGGCVWARMPASWLEQRDGIADLASKVLQRCHVVATPGWFYGKEYGEYLRFALVAPVDRLREVGTRVTGFVDGRAEDNGSGDGLLRSSSHRHASRTSPLAKASGHS